MLIYLKLWLIAQINDLLPKKWNWTSNLAGESKTVTIHKKWKETF